NPYSHPSIEAPAISGVENPGNNSIPDNSFFKIYPNPTPGKFTLELKDNFSAAQVHIEIYGVLGERILSKEMLIDRKQEFSLIEKPTGVYVVHVTAGLNSETEKIIKQ
ncbi:MAG: T9SS type A sorting domain-containing protein, partial [Bacteroidetes bacterium]|nr:T9SS type A sorting domain-containing protein [Bacteroidota bacterium]